MEIFFTSRNGAWGDTPHDITSNMWGDDSKSIGWNDHPMTSPSWTSKPKTPTGAPGTWPDQDIDLGGWNSQSKVGKLSFLPLINLKFL